jgi:hypothetical protein
MAGNNAKGYLPEVLLRRRAVSRTWVQIGRVTAAAAAVMLVSLGGEAHCHHEESTYRAMFFDDCTAMNVPKLSLVSEKQFRNE